MRYQKQLADTVYFRNLANNAGVLDLLDRRGRRAGREGSVPRLRACCAARRGRWPKAEIDNFCEAFLRERFGLEIDFEIQDALGKLERLGLVAHEGETYSAVAPADALAKLDAAWDGLFNFSARR